MAKGRVPDVATRLKHRPPRWDLESSVTNGTMSPMFRRPWRRDVEPLLLALVTGAVLFALAVLLGRAQT
jgi:hypothetical protein